MKAEGSAQKLRGRHLSRPHRPFWGPWRCRWRASAPFTARLVFLCHTGSKSSPCWTLPNSYMLIRFMKTISVDVCKADRNATYSSAPAPTPAKLDWVSINITTELSHPPPTHPPRIVLVWSSSIYLNETTKITYIIRLLELSKLDLFKTRLQFINALFITCSWQLMTCSWIVHKVSQFFRLVHYLGMTYFWLIVQFTTYLWLVPNLSLTRSLHVQYLLLTCSWHVHCLLMTFPWLANEWLVHDFLQLVHNFLTIFSQCGQHFT